MPATPALFPVPALNMLRLRKRWTQAQLAARAGVSRESVINLEAGHPARIDTIEKLAAALGATVDELIEGKDITEHESTNTGTSR